MSERIRIFEIWYILQAFGAKISSYLNKALAFFNLSNIALGLSCMTFLIYSEAEWLFLLCALRFALDLNILSHMLQGMVIPS